MEYRDKCHGTLIDSNIICRLFIPQLETYYFGSSLNIHACIHTPHDKTEYEEILYFLLHRNKSNNAFVFDIVNILGIININNIICKNWCSAFI